MHMTLLQQKKLMGVTRPLFCLLTLLISSSVLAGDLSELCIKNNLKDNLKDNLVLTVVTQNSIVSNIVIDNKSGLQCSNSLGQGINSIILTKKLPKTPQNIVIIPQLVASVTSVGANDQEADAANSRKDFVAKYSIVRKEGKESLYWLRVIKDTNSPEYKEVSEEFIKEGQEISFIVSSIMKNTNNKN